jgi:hypothetical protein
VAKFNGFGNYARPDGTKEEGWFSFTCGHCGRAGSGAVLAYSEQLDEMMSGRKYTQRWVVCPTCGEGTYINTQEQAFPSPRTGVSVEGLPDAVREAYEEARTCHTVHAYTACELICRKILMHVAVDKGAPEGGTFASYITFLESQGYVTPPMKPWVDQIRQNGNESTHCLSSPQVERSESTLMFTAELLRLTYEMDHMRNKFVH